MGDIERGTFVYANPPTIHWGSGCVAERLGEELAGLGARRVFLVTTRSVARNDNLVGALNQVLGERLVGEFDAIGQHAPAESIAAAAKAARAARPDVLISFGGGSPIDATKLVAMALATGIDVAEPGATRRAGEAKLVPGQLPPHLAIPTTLSTAELASGAGFTSGEGEKVGVRVSALRPRAVFYDGQLALETPLDLWLSTGIRAVDHAVEGILASGSHPFSDTIALEALRRLRAGLRAAKANPGDAEARTEGQLGAWFSYTLPGPSAAGLSHTLGKRLGSRHGIPHGITSCLLLPHVMRYLEPRTRSQQQAIARALESDGSAADAVSALIGELGPWRRLRDYGLTDSDLDDAVRPVATAENPAAGLREILHQAW